MPYNNINRIKNFLLEKAKLDEELVADIIIDIQYAPKKLLTFPKIGQKIEDGITKNYYRLLVRNYKLYYEIGNDVIYIIDILHSKEDIEGI